MGKKKSTKEVNEAAKKILERYRLTAPTAVSSTEDRQMRLVSRFVNEALLCLEEQVIARPVRSRWCFSVSIQVCVM